MAGWLISPSFVRRLENASFLQRSHKGLHAKDLILCQAAAETLRRAHGAAETISNITLSVLNL
jgi:hypothetical protein